MEKRLSYLLAFMFAVLQTFAQTYTYDKLNRLTQVVYENGVTVTYGYDALGNRTSKTVTGASGATYTITVNVSPSGSGSVTGGGTYAANSTVELRAIPNAGYAFSKWSNNKTDNPLSLTVTDNLSLTAYFTESQSDLEGDVNGDGAVDVADIATIIDIMAGVGADPISALTADVNRDGTVDVADIATVISIMAGQSVVIPDDNGHAPAGVEAVDLGLPSGTLWANMNVGAEKPSDYGLFFAWGETTGYTSDTSDGRAFDWASYKWMNEGQTNSRQINKYQVADDQIKACWYNSSGQFIGDGKTILDLSDDAARANWGGQWMMPTNGDFTELLDNTTSEWTNVNNTEGMKFTSKTNGNSIFFPASGSRRYTSIYNQGTSAYYRSSSLVPTNTTNAFTFYISNSGTAEMTDPSRSFGFVIRPVINKSAINK